MSKRRLYWFFLGAGLISWVAAFTLVLLPVFPHILYRLSPGTPNQLAQGIAATADIPPPKLGGGQEVVLPPQDKSLPSTNRLAIPKIKVDGQLNEGTDWENILKTGIWIVPDFGTPPTSKPVILASHRWGYLDWSSDFRQKNSFYRLPELKVGDQVQIIYDQRLYTYEVYRAETATAIADYSADLILYTCELWNSPRRIFRYAKRIL